MAKLETGEYLIDSESEVGKTYILSIKRRGANGMQVHCSCLGFRYRKSCKHVSAVKNGEYVA